MKIISLNMWAAKLREPLEKFILEHRDSTDIFCFQEMTDSVEDIEEYDELRPKALTEMKRLLYGWDFRFAPSAINEGFNGPAEIDARFGLCIASKKHIDNYSDRLLIEPTDLPYQKGILTRRVLQTHTFMHNGQSITLFNYHGLWNGQGKDDSEERIQQSKSLKSIMDQFNDSQHILMGDLNLNKGTESLAILASGMKDLVEESGATTTRSSHYPKIEQMPFADYTFVSQDLAVQSFSVLPDEVSDHLAMMLEI